MAKKNVEKEYNETGENSSEVNIPVVPEDPKALERLINEIEFTGSGIELLNMRPRILHYLKKLRASGVQ